MVYIQRELENKIVKHITRKEIVAVIGARQVGKTTLINHILKDKKRVNYVSFDNVQAKILFETNIDAFIELYVKGFDYLFIDEIQYAKNSGQQLKYIQDTQQIKLFISGSSASELSIQSLQFLVGRVLIYILYPLSFSEFLNFKDKKILNLIRAKNIKGVDKVFKLLKEFILYGGYPEAILGKTEEEKELVLKNIYNTYLLKEIKEILNISEDYKLIKLLKAISLQIGNIIDYNELSQITDFSAYEVKKKLNILEKTFVCKQSNNYHTNKRSELKKSPKIFFIDSGFRNTIINNFSKERTDIGFLYENFIATELLKKDFEIKYWRTRSKAEIDFVLEKNGIITPIEIKKTITKKTIGKSLFSFIEIYKPKQIIIYSENYNGTRTIKNTKINFKQITNIINIQKELSENK